MASLQVLKPTLSLLSLSHSNSPRKSTCDSPHSYSQKSMPKLRTFGVSKSCTRFKVCCGAQNTENHNTAEEPPESLFMKELKRRGMTPKSLVEDYKQGNYELDEEIYLNEEDRPFPKRNSVSTNVDSSTDNQRERSMELNSEGLEGLVPRAKLLLTIGGTLFLGFWPVIFTTVASFSALYFEPYL